jgi:amino acid transporter
MQSAIAAYASAPIIAGKHIFINLPAALIVAFITFLAYIGIKESKKTTNLMVIFKIAVIVLIIVMGFFYVDTNNWTPFLPNGFGGVLAGVSAVFYAYIGFDAISTTAEECKNPQRDLPRGMIYSLIICTVLYILIALVLTGMVNYTELNVSDPLAFVFDRLGMKTTGYIISISAVVATTSVLLVFQLGQPRIWMTMSRDGLMPKRFSTIHPKYKTPSFATLVTGLVVGIPIFFTDENFVLDFTSIGTLFAFVLVCGGVLMLSPQSEAEIAERETKGKFRIPYVNAKFIFPVLVAIATILIIKYVPDFFTNLFDFSMDKLATNIPMLVFILVCIVMTVLSFTKNLSLIPLLGLISCCYLLTGMAVSNWMWFGVWLVIGLVIYFAFSYKNSKLNDSIKF